MVRAHEAAHTVAAQAHHEPSLTAVERTLGHADLAVELRAGLEAAKAHALADERWVSTSLLVQDGKILDTICTVYEYSKEVYVWPDVSEVGRSWDMAEHAWACTPAHLAVMSKFLAGCARLFRNSLGRAQILVGARNFRRNYSELFSTNSTGTRACATSTTRCGRTAATWASSR